jgi:glycosyltransferase involved in cell wall biosynthesis
VKPMVTVGLCVRNCETSIRDTIDSIMEQDYPHDRIKVVFVDDGSKDQTLSIVRDCIRRIDMTAFVFHTSWNGVGNARNAVIANAEGDYILWVDGDMILSRDFLARLVEFMEKNPKAGIAKGRQALVPGRNALATLEAYSRAAGRMVDYQSRKGASKALGTGGSLYRVKAVEDVGSFDRNLRGYNEDWDIEQRFRKAGWSLRTLGVTFHDYERYGLTWKSLWSKYWLRGYYTHYFLHKNKGLIKHYRMFPPAASLSGLLSSLTLFRLTRQKVVFFLPIQHTFKMTAWYCGFLGGHFNSYAPDSLEKQSHVTRLRSKISALEKWLKRVPVNKLNRIRM